jgi:outer membrane biosynthesis protein TonB
MAAANCDVLYDLVQPSTEQKTLIEDRAAKDADMVIQKPVELPPPPPKKKRAAPVKHREEEEEEEDDEEDEPTPSDEDFIEDDISPPVTKKKTTTVVAPKKKAAPKKKKAEADESKKDAKKKKRPLTGAAAASSAKKKQNSDSSAAATTVTTPISSGSTDRHPPGFSMVKAERDRIDRALTALKRRVATRADKDKLKGKKTTTTVCSILNASLIKFYSRIRTDFETEFNEYLEEKKQDS